MPQVGITEMMIVLVIVLLVFGPKRLPEMGRTIGSGIRSLKDGLSGIGDDDADTEPEAGRDSKQVRAESVHTA